MINLIRNVYNHVDKDAIIEKQGENITLISLQSDLQAQGRQISFRATRSKAMAANVQIFMSDEGRNSEKIKDLKHFIGVLKKWSTSIVELSRC
jgi:hypothetical protein